MNPPPSALRPASTQVKPAAGPVAEHFQAGAVVCPEKNGAEAMSDSYIIEIGSQAAGIVVRDPRGYRFFAASHRFNPLEGRLFRNAREAERAARLLADGGLMSAA